MAKNQKRTDIKETHVHEEDVNKDFTVSKHGDPVDPQDLKEPLLSDEESGKLAHEATSISDIPTSDVEIDSAGTHPPHGKEHLDDYVDDRHPDLDVHRGRHHHRPDFPVGTLHREHHEVGSNLSWGAVLAGLVTFLALSLLFSLVGAAIGLGATDVSAAQPFDGVGSGMLIWTLVSLVASLAAAGYVAGYVANRAGFIHGFLTWALGLIAATVLASSAISGAFNAVGSMLGVTGKAAGDAIGTISKSAGNLSEDAFDAIADEMQIDTTNLDQDVQEALKDSDIEALQPNYLQGQLDDTVKDIQDAAKKVVVDGQPVDQSLQAVYDNIEQRLTTIGQGLNEQELTDALAKNTDLTQAEADEAAQNIKESYAQAQSQAKDALSKAKTEINRLETEGGQALEEGKENADKAMNNASKYAMYGFIGSLLGMLLSSYAGKKGAEKGHDVDDDRVLSLEDEVVVK